MSDENQSRNRNTGNSGKRGDNEDNLQEELDRESVEGVDSVGDVGSNRNLSGSSSWETLPKDRETGRDASQGDKTPKR